MTDEQILATAEACGMTLFGLGLHKKKFEFCLLVFAKQIAKLEREACAKVCEDASTPDVEELQSDGQWGALVCAAAIRARGEA
jgi:hypothetical protein